MRWKHPANENWHGASEGLVCGWGKAKKQKSKVRRYNKGLTEDIEEVLCIL